MGFKVVELPAELAEMLKEHLQNMHKAMDAPAPVLEDSPGGRDLLHLVRTIGKELSGRLTSFSTELHSDRFTPRLYSFNQTGKGGKARWVPLRLTIATKDVLSGNPAKLREMCDDMGRGAEATYASIWVRGAPEHGKDVFFAFLRHQDGTEAAYSIEQGTWHRINASQDALEHILHSTLHADDDTRRKWVSILSSGAAVANDTLRTELMPLLYSWGLPPMSDDQWKELMHTIFFREGYWDAITMAARVVCTPAMHEAQYLVDALSNVVKTMRDEHERRITALEKEHGRTLKRVRSELDRTKVMLDGAHTRNRMLVKDVLTLQDKARAQPAAPAGTPAAAPQKDVTFAVALDQFFD